MGLSWNMGRLLMMLLYLSPLIFLFIILSSIASSYVNSPRTYQTGVPLQIQVSKLWSTKAQLSYDYNYLKYCNPRDNRCISNSIYTFHMLKDQPRRVACLIILDAESSNKFKGKIDDEYQVHMILDNLPLLRRRIHRQRWDEENSTTVEHGFHVGFKLNITGVS